MMADKWFETVADPSVALLLVTAQPWDLVVTDLELPVTHSLELMVSCGGWSRRFPS